jgi:septal ring factor EnvC (AmiA/AmiB activator)
MGKLGRLILSLALAALAASLAAQEPDSAVSERVAGLRSDGGAIAESLGAIDEDLGSIDKLASAILGETGNLKLDVERLQAKLRELQRLNGEAGEEIGRLNARIAALMDRAKVLGDRYEEVIGIAKGYKAKYKRTKIVAIALGIGTVALGGALIGVAAAK